MAVQPSAVAAASEVAAAAHLAVAASGRRWRLHPAVQLQGRLAFHPAIRPRAVAAVRWPRQRRTGGGGR